MENDQKKKNAGINIHQHSSLGLIWLGGWLFTIGFLKLTFWQGALALLIWPYYVGNHYAAPEPTVPYEDCRAEEEATATLP